MIPGVKPEESFSLFTILTAVKHPMIQPDYFEFDCPNDILNRELIRFMDRLVTDYRVVVFIKITTKALRIFPYV